MLKGSTSMLPIEKLEQLVRRYGELEQLLCRRRSSPTAPSSRS